MRVAAIEASGATSTFGELAERANRVTHGLRSIGLGIGDAVAAVLPNEASMLELNLAALQGGLYLVPINNRLTAPEIAYILDDSGARVLVCSPRFADACRQAVTVLRAQPTVLATGEGASGFGQYQELLAGMPATRPEARSAGAPLHYQSGTTGRPKGVRLRLPRLDTDNRAHTRHCFL